MFLFFIYALFGLYFINISVKIVKIPESFAGLNSAISVIGGILLIVGGFYLINAGKRRFGYPYMGR